MDDATRTELEAAREQLEAAAFRRLLAHLDERSDVQNIDLMNLAGFCRNCLSRWYQEAANAEGIPLGKEDARAIVYGMPYEDWRAKHQTEAAPDQQAAFERNRPKDH
ncbi:hypothetical protein SAMN05444336_102695 [Albimonas donghaensis]|uniref:SMc04008-like domain-containing protein n=1 Tax=Albimonas donghaensis TaxID=356660 RepID=A0A1H2XD52_9RHOB|nr:DUF1244 domain-containing protein [Albimonas donghaensis]SDW90757.1 hypothetical protein SAMN05444336_102695 [Albimonas donghaensis]